VVYAEWKNKSLVHVSPICDIMNIQEPELNASYCERLRVTHSKCTPQLMLAKMSQVLAGWVNWR
jgi:hypothetical protein